MRREITLKRVENTIQDFKEDESRSKYYIELKKSYKEFESMQVHTKKIDKLYLKHMNDLCEYLDEKRNYKKLTIIMFIMLICTICFTAYSSYKYYKLRNNMIPRIIENRPDIKLEVSYKNFHNFSVQTLNSNYSYKDLNYITLDINAKGDDKEVQYNIYLVPVDYNDNSIKLDTIKINIKNDDIITLDSNNLVDGKIKVYTGKMRSNETISHDIRMWIEEEDLYQTVNKSLNLQIYVDGYVL